MELCKLVSSADDDAFAQRIGDFIDLDAAARYFACEVLLSNYDGILMNGQNFLLWLDPRSGKLGFSPWDLDHSWGAFNQVGTDVERERASAFHPWVGRKRFLERLFAAPAFATAYRRELTRISTTLFTTERLDRRIDALAEAIRPAVAEDPGNRLGSFDHAVGPPLPREDNGEGGRHSKAYQLKRFIRNRAESIADQLAGKDPGIELKRGHGW
jgi:spore coat protein CotH